MKLNYLLDISENSKSFSHTPSLASLKLPFYIYNFGRFFAGKDYFTEREGVDNYLLFYTLSGSGKLIYKGSEYKISKKQAVIINCNEYHYYKSSDEGFWDFIWIHLSGTACANYCDLINENSLNVVDFVGQTCIEESFTEICRLKVEEEPLSDIKFSMYLTKIITDLAINRFNLYKNDSFSQQKILVNDVLIYIQKNYNNRIYLDQLAKYAHVSKYHLIRIFKKHFGRSPYEYLINFRINKSKALLKESTLTVNEISSLVGYNDVTNFIRDFKKYLGTTPLKYRNYWIS